MNKCIEENNQNRIRKVVVLIASIIVIVIAYLPHLQNQMFAGSDDIFHYSRIYSISEGLKQGVFPVKIHATAAYGYGYGVGFFYSDALLYIPAILMCAGVSLITAYKIFALFVYIAIFTLMYYSVWKLTYHYESAFFAASMLLFSNKVMESFYTTIALGQMTAFIFAPMAIIGMYIFLVNDEKPYLLITGFTGLIFTHTLSTFLAFLTCIYYVLVNIKRIFRNKKWFHLLCSVAYVTAVTAAYWIPMLEQMKAQWHKVRHPWTVSEKNVQPLRYLITRKEGLGYLICGAFLFCIAIVIFEVRKKYEKDKIKEIIRSFLIPAVGMAFLTSCLPFWHFMNSDLNINILQFPSRLNMVVTILILAAWALAYASDNINAKFKRIMSIVLLLLGMIASYRVFSEDYLCLDSSRIEQVTNNEVAGLGAGEEWLPLETDREELMDSSAAIDDMGNSVAGQKINGYTKYIFEADLSRKYYIVPYIWYKGFAAYDSAGNSFDIEKNLDTGLVEVHMPEDGQGIEKITVSYVGTKYQKLAYCGSILGILMLLTYIIVTEKKLWKIK